LVNYFCCATWTTIISRRYWSFFIWWHQLNFFTLFYFLWGRIFNFISLLWYFWWNWFIIKLLLRYVLLKIWFSDLFT
jgi:hypothetical protein